MFNLFKTKSLGVEISPRQIKIAFLEKQKNKIFLRKTEKKFFENDNLDEKFTYLKEKIPQITKKKSFSGEIITAPPLEKTFLVYLTNLTDLPPQKTPEEDEYLKKKIQEYIPLPLNEIYWQRQRINSQNLLLAAAEKNVVDLYLEKFRNIGFPLTHLDLKAFALTRALLSWQETEKEDYLILNIEEDCSSFTLGNNQKIKINLSLPVTSETICQTIKEKLSLTKGQTLKAERICGLNAQKGKGAVRKILEPLFNKIIQEIENALLFCQENLAEVKIKGIIISGEGAYLKDLDKFLEKKLKIKTTLASPQLHLASSSNNLVEYSAAIGLALKPLTPKKYD